MSLIDSEAVFNSITEYRNLLCEIFGDENELIRVVDIVKHRLIALPSAQPDKDTNVPSNDCISRQAAIDALADYIHNVDKVYSTGKLSVDDCRDAAKSVLDDLPSAQPERPTGKWIATTSLQEGQITWKDYKCSNCSHHREKPMNFCEVCGAKMER